MPEHISITEAARRFGISDRTLRNWVRWGWIEADRVIIEGRAHQLLSADKLQALIKERGLQEHTGKPEYSGMTNDIAEFKNELQRLAGAISNLENTMESLNARLSVLEQARDAPSAPPRQIIAPRVQTPLASSQEQKSTLPDGWAGLEEFRHSIPETSARRWVKSNGGIAGDWRAANGKKVAIALPPEIQHAYYLHFSQKIEQFEPCENCPHEPQVQEQ